MRAVYFLVLLLSLSLVVDDVHAGWKFWKKKDKDGEDAGSPEAGLSSTSTSTSTTTTTTTTTTTVAPSTTASSGWKFWKKDKSTVAPTPTTQRATTAKILPTPKPNANKGIAAAADPALAVGVGSVSGKIHEDARNQPRKPSPGTEVGLDIGLPKPARPGTGGSSPGSYRDWAADLTGAGEPGRQSPKLPSQPPALAPNGNNRPASVPGTPVTQPSSTPAPANKPPSSFYPGGQQTGAHAPAQPTKPTAAPVAQPTKPTVAPVAQPTKPTAAPVAQPTKPTAAPVAQPAKPTLAPAFPTAKPKTWAEVAGGGSSPGSRSGSPTPAPKPGTVVRSGQAPFEYPQQQPGRNNNNNNNKPGVSAAGTAAAGVALAGGAVAAGAAATAANNADSKYSANPSYSKGKGVTDEDLEKLSEALFIKDVNNANKYITLNLQKRTSGDSSKDEAPQPLLTVEPKALEIPTIQRVLSIYDNYKLDTRENEYISPLQRQEESLLVDTFLSTNVMSTAMRFLADKEYLKKDYYDYKDALRLLWFNLYSRGEGKIGSTGFEHVFLTELKLGTEVSGLHNWIYFNSEELKKRLDYLGYIKKVDLGNKAAIVKVHLRFNGIDKPVSNVFIGTSPELEMALYTVCFYARPDAACPVSLGGTKFNIVTHKFKYRGREHIGSAYPEI